ncbi:polysaccharide export protein [Methylonatrum kenyense]|uniref:XrtA/PEP-CTERM system exopolysaccharide export protein n=1 Tax=Methylonatrum kenyense TaxID=455253 RepID=UPI0020BEDAC9|nr:XrtA/PEP-CTERM system exopolysaccharide export protein [Methylonatrum kenyense]MCK8516771.1 polysaccharide export protein [Methylonatrum kenyense]
MTRSRLLARMLLVFLTFSLVACAGGQTRGTVPTPADIGDADYVIGPGDQLRVYVRNNPDMSVDIPVRPDGKISVPMVQSVRAAGKTPSVLAEDLESELSAFIRDPNVTVMVTGFVGTYEDQIRVIGQAVQPQAIAYRDGMTVLDAVIEVGGLTQFAAGNRARLVRGTGDDSRTYNVRLNDLISNGDMRQNHPLRPGDVLVIPESIF